MATKEVIWDLVSLMASMWTFPGKDLKMTAEGYHMALRDLSDTQVKEAVTALLSEWGKAAPPKPADILLIAKETAPVSNKPSRLPPRERSHDEIMQKIWRDTYHMQAIQDVLGEKRRHDPSERWSREEWLAISKRQGEYREEILEQAGTG